MDEKEKKDRKVLQDFYNDLENANKKSLERQMDWATDIKERSFTFAQFLASIGAALLAVFFSVEEFKNLVIRQDIFFWSVFFYSISFLFFIISSKEKIDVDSLEIVNGGKQNEINYQKSLDVLNKQFQDGINVDVFYKDIENLFNEYKEEKAKYSKSIADYSLELNLFSFMVSFWLLFFSTKDWHLTYLFIGIVVIFYISNNQNKFFYRLMVQYSKIMNKIFPIKDNCDY